MDNYYVTKRGEKWRFAKEGAKRATHTAETKQEIVGKMRNYMANKEGSVKIANSLNGQFQEERTYPRRSDPPRTKG